LRTSGGCAADEERRLPDAMEFAAKPGSSPLPCLPRELLAVVRATVTPMPRRDLDLDLDLDLDHILHWPAWRRHHQHRATTCHRRWNNITAAATTCPDDQDQESQLPCLLQLRLVEAARGGL
jgi:hypothetical protein